MVAVADRRSLGAKDMVITMCVVLVVVALIALYGNNVSFSPGATVKPDTEAIPTVDVEAGFGHAKSTFDFPITVPVGLPEGWHPNSLSVSDPSAIRAGVTAVGTLKLVRGGWITPSGKYIQLVEAAADTQETLYNEFEEGRSITGEVSAGGSTWSVTSGLRDEVAWVRTTDAPDGMTTFLITGNAAESDFKALAASLNE